MSAGGVDGLNALAQFWHGVFHIAFEFEGGIAVVVDFFEGGDECRQVDIAFADDDVLRLIVSDPEAGQVALKKAGFTTVVNDVLAVEMDDKPGSLAKLLDVLKAKNINVEYMYAFFITIAGDAVVLFKVGDDALDRTLGVLERAGVPVIPSEQIYKL